MDTTQTNESSGREESADHNREQVTPELIELHYRNELAKVLRVDRDPLPSLPDLLIYAGTVVATAENHFGLPMPRWDLGDG